MNRTAEQVVQEWRENGGQDWDDLVSRINYWAMTDMCPSMAAQRAPEPPADAPADTLGPPNWSERVPEPRYQGLEQIIGEWVLGWAALDGLPPDLVKRKIANLAERLAAAEPREGDDAKTDRR